MSNINTRENGAGTSSRQMALRILIGNHSNIFIICPQSGLLEPEKDKFYFNLLSYISCTEETLIVCGDLNGHVGKDAVSFEGVHGGLVIASVTVKVPEYLNYARS